MLSITVWTGTNRVALCLAFVLTSNWITLTSLIPIFLRQSWKHLSWSTIAVKSEWALRPLMQLHVTTFTHFMAQTSLLTCSVLTRVCSLLVPMQPPKKQVCPPFFSHLGWEVVFYIPGLIPPMWMRLSRNELCCHWDPSLVWGR